MIDKQNELDLEQLGTADAAPGSTISSSGGGASEWGAVDDGDADADDDEEEFDSGQLLFQSIPRFPDTEVQALETYTGYLRTPLPAADSSNTRPSSGTIGRSRSKSAADDFIEALLKTTRASLASSNPNMQHQQPQSAAMDPQEPGTAADSQAQPPSSTISPISTAASAQEGTAQQTGSSTVLQALTAASESHADADSQKLADTASAVEGQVLVTQAEMIPSMQQYSQVVLMSLKLRPMPAQELLSKAASGGDGPTAVTAAAWQDNLRQALEAAVALETNTSAAHMHTRMTSILNLVRL